MLRSMNGLLGFTIAATDGDIGGVEAFYFDDTSFTIRHLVVDTGGWLPSGSDLDQKVSRQVEEAVRGADLIVFLVDAAVGITDLVVPWPRSSEPYAGDVATFEKIFS